MHVLLQDVISSALSITETMLAVPRCKTLPLCNFLFLLPIASERGLELLHLADPAPAIDEGEQHYKGRSFSIGEFT